MLNKHIKAAILFLISLNSAGSELFIELQGGIVVRESDVFETQDGQKFEADYGSDLRANVRLGYRTENCFFFSVCKVGFSHESSPTRGAPFNDKYEISTDQFFISGEIIIPVRFGNE